MRYVSTKKHYEKLINIKDILPYQLQLWRWILKKHISFGETFTNPYRNDKHPDCYLKNTNGILRFIDFPDFYVHKLGWHNKGVIDFIMKVYGCDFKRALQLAYYEGLSDNLSLHTPIEFKKEKRESPFLIKQQYRNWNITDKQFWNGSTGITAKQLQKEQCYPISKYWCTDKTGIYRPNTPKTETYINHINSRQKIYQPKTRLFLTNFINEDIGGFKSFDSNDTIIITKNLKSYCCISNLGYNCRYTPNEGMYFEEMFINQINSQFKNIYLLFDNDIAGQAASKLLTNQWQQVSQRTINPIHFNEKFLEEHYYDPFGNKKTIKDAFDICKKYDLEKLDKELKQLLCNYLEKNELYY